MAAAYPTTAGPRDGGAGSGRTHLPRPAWARPVAVLVVASGLTVGAMSAIASLVSRWV